MTTVLKKSGIISQLMELIPSTGNQLPSTGHQQTEENFVKTLQEKNLDEVGDMTRLLQ